MQNYDLNFNGLIIGAARASKSTLMLQMVRRIYAQKLKVPINTVDSELINPKLPNSPDAWVFKNIIYNKKQALIPFKTNHGQVIAGDEMYFVADRRNSYGRGSSALYRISSRLCFK